mmetsp:Transcript_67106/g.140167  ORF Transcript_67106/g.140167 Transcript_67106/m.140167 type:complete len:218 (+) Transcript_67106:4571-5224(+)
MWHVDCVGHGDPLDDRRKVAGAVGGCLRSGRQGGLQVGLVCGVDHLERPVGRRTGPSTIGRNFGVVGGRAHRAVGTGDGDHHCCGGAGNVDCTTLFDAHTVVKSDVFCHVIVGHGPVDVVGRRHSRGRAFRHKVQRSVNQGPIGSQTHRGAAHHIQVQLLAGCEVEFFAILRQVVPVRALSHSDAGGTSKVGQALAAVGGNPHSRGAGEQLRRARER